MGTEDSKTTQVLRKEEPPMSESRPNKAVTDEELIGVLTAISVVSKRLARKLIQLNQHIQLQQLHAAEFIAGNINYFAHRLLPVF